MHVGVTQHSRKLSWQVGADLGPLLGIQPSTTSTIASSSSRGTVTKHRGPEADDILHDGLRKLLRTRTWSPGGARQPTSTPDGGALQDTVRVRQHSNRRHHVSQVRVSGNDGAAHPKIADTS